MRRIVVLLLFCLGLGLAANGQQQQMYTQFMYNKLALNPAFSGNESYLSASLLYRDQWNGFPGAPKAQVFNVNLPRIGNRIGLAVNFERQTIGITEKITYELMYAYKFLLGDGTLSMGMNVSGRNYKQDYTDSRLFAIQDITIDPSIPQTIQSINLINAGFGVYYNTNTFFIGASVPRMIKADIDFDKNNLFSTEVRHLFLMTGGTFIINNDLRLTPQLLFRAAENTPFGIDLNGSLTIKNTYSAGLTYRTGGTQGDLGESIDLIFSYQLSEQIMMGFAYDIGLSKLRTASNGSLEVILTYNMIPKKIKSVIINPRYF
ncbi:MAG: PorP/SprF family type IX secretion system membrane protein [Chitinophagales bacterium]|nr:PorP/SprF family type IX secretion system membrane protein [Chitinophagales bacterium]